MKKNGVAIRESVISDTKLSPELSSYSKDVLLERADRALTIWIHELIQRRIPVQSTNDASTVSKCSAVSKNYFKDDFINEFVEKKKSRASLIHLGYYTRAVIINKLVTNFIEFVNLQKFLKVQIINCGSGFDTAYWRLSEAGLLRNSLFIEIDFSTIIKKKISLINQSVKLSSYLCKSSNKQGLEGINKLNFNYYLLEADLSDLNLIEKLFDGIRVNYNIPTLILSECVITYMKEPDSSNLIKWIAAKFKNSTFVNYEQMHPEDGFGQVMLNHFDKFQSSLFSVYKYPNIESHFLRYKNCGFKNSFCVSEWDALICLTTAEERQRVFSLELFDEFEEFHMKCVHYVVAVAESGASCHLIKSLRAGNPTNRSFSRANVGVDKLPCDLELFRHASCNANGCSFVFGGSNRQSRSPKIYKISYNNFLEVKEIKSSGHLELDMVYGTVAYFEINKVPFVCLYGGRTSPDKIWNNGSPVIFEYSGNEFSLKLVVTEGNPISRFRTQMVSVNPTENEALCWIFGGRRADLSKPLSDFWQLRIKEDNENNLTYEWKEFEKKNENWPCSRMSHSFTTCPERSELFIVGGLSVDSSSVLNDMWKWRCRSQSWEKVQLAGKLLPRYGHTAHLKDNAIYLVGGVNTLAGSQPSLAKIDLNSLTVTEFAMSLPDAEPVLFFNHTSELFGFGDDVCICVFGGGGNCFSFGTYLNSCAVCVKISCLS